MHWIWNRAFAGVVLGVVALAASRAIAATPAAGFVSTVVASGLSRPTAMAVAPDGRIFVAEQDGALRVIKDGVLLPAPFLSVTVNASGERGLLGVAFDPQFPSAPFVYVYYTAASPTVHNRVSRFTAAGDVAVAGSELPLLDLPPLVATNHNGGAVHVGPDGYLYIAVGENAVGSNAQSLNTPLGKILRIARDGSIPETNPFFGQTSGINRAIWALGLRNPFTFAFDPWSGRLLINDVGQNTWEEINEGFAGANYGWPLSEGPTVNPAHTSPVYAYTHASTGGCAITGGAFYPVVPTQFPADYAGDYFFADLCAGWIRRYDFSTGLVPGNFVGGISAPVDLAIGPEGALYYLARGGGATTGTLERIDAVGTGSPFAGRLTNRGVRTGRTARPRHAAGSTAGTARQAAEPPAPARGGERRETQQDAGVPPARADDLRRAGSGSWGTAAGRPTFQSARVAPSTSSGSAIALGDHDDGWVRISGATLRQLIELASDLPLSSGDGSAGGADGRQAGSQRDGVALPPLQIAGGPAWLDRQRWDVEAYAGAGRPLDEVRGMLHALLEERFGLAAHFTRQPGRGVEAFVLTIERAGRPR